VSSRFRLQGNVFLALISFGLGALLPGEHGDPGIGLCA